MFFKYGNYLHDRAECSAVISRDYSTGAFGNNTGYTETWNVTGRLHGDTRALLTGRINALLTAYRTNGRDLELLDVDGTTQTAHRLLSGPSINGVKITNFGFVDSRNAEYSTFRNYSYTATAEYLTTLGDSSNGSQSSLSFTGTGGPKFVVRTTLNGPPIRQQVAAFTPVGAIQSGSRTSLFSSPEPDAPIYADAREHQNQRNVIRTSSASEGRLTFTTSWNYNFLDITSF